MSLKSVLAAASIVAAVLLATFVRIQPSGDATIFRDGSSISVHTHALYLRPLRAAERCRAATIADRLQFDAPLPAATATRDELPLRVRFAYVMPDVVPAGWPGSDWCASLLARVTALTRQAARVQSADSLLADRRAATERIASAVSQQLARDGVRVESTSVLVDLPKGFDRLRTMTDLARQSRAARPVIFVGLDGADWQLLDDYMRNGSMPNLNRLVANGAGGVLETDYPPLSPLVWTTMMTGTGPLDHGILDFTRFNPYTHEKEPITSDERLKPAVWNMLTWAGKKTAVFGLWATYAAEPVHGINVSDRLFTFLYSDQERPAGVVWPPSRGAWSQRALSDAESAVNAARIREYLPAITGEEFAALAKSNNPYADPPAALRRILLETEIYRRASDGYLHEEAALPDLTIVYLQGTDTIGHVFAPFAPPKQPQVAQADYDRYSGVPARYFREIDDLIGRYAAIAQQHGAILMIASDHGFFWREGRPVTISSTATATAAKWHRKEGIYLLYGPGIAAAPHHPLRGSVRQVCATLLALTGMPNATGGYPQLDGTPPSATATFDYAGRFSRADPPPPPHNRNEGSEDIAKLKALGYIGSTEATRPASAGGGTKTAGAFNNEGLILRNEHRIDDAIAAFEKSLAVDPNYASAMWNESETLFDTGRDLDRADRLLISAAANGLADAVTFIIKRSIAYEKSGKSGRSLQLLDAAVTARPSEAELRMFRGRYRMEAHDCVGALDDFRTAIAARPENPLAYAASGLAQACLGDEAGARASFARAHALDPNQPVP
jgi:tetratricopeptide (TPR) repeat protein